MCLEINRWRHWKLKPKIAKRDIPCYKVLNVSEGIRDYMSVDLWTPYQNTRIDIENIKHGLYSEMDMPKWNEVHEMYTISKGIHSCRSLRSAKRIQKDIYSGVILNAIIPKGTSYYIGKNGTYVSTKIIF